jgi:CubicO group peptidase (beta-lactamase class C family)
LIDVKKGFLMKKTFLGLLFLLLLLAGCRREEPLKWSDTPYLNVTSPWVDSTLHRMSTEQKIGQLIYLDVDARETDLDELPQWAQRDLFGGVQLRNLSVDSYRELQREMLSPSSVAILFGTEEQLLLNNQFTGTGAVPGYEVLRYFNEYDSLRHLSRTIFKRQLQALQINTQFSPFQLFTEGAADLLASGHLQFIQGLSGASLVQQPDTAYWKSSVHQQLVRLQDEGVAGFVVPAGLMEEYNLSPAQIADLYRKQLDFKGLLVAETNETSALPLMAGTVDLLRVKNDPLPVYQSLLAAYQSGVLTDRELDIRVAKVLQAKEWVRQQKEAQQEELQLASSEEQITYDQAGVLSLGNTKEDTVASPISLGQHFDETDWRLLNRQFYEKTSVLLYNRNQLLPFKDLYRYYYRLVHLGDDSREDMEEAFSHYADYSRYYHLPDAGGKYPRLRISPTKGEVCIVTVNQSLDGSRDSILLADLRHLAVDREVVLVHFGQMEGLQSLDTTFTVLHFPEFNATTQSLAAQVLFGGASPQGKLPLDINACFQRGLGVSLPVTRLSYQLPEAVGIAPEKLVGIDAIANSAIADGAFPGCQVVVAKSGSIIYSKAFGYHDYERKQRVVMNDLYDVASVTKVAATTLTAMKLYEQGKLRVNDKIKNYLDCPASSTIKNIPIKKLLIHQSGLQPHMPVIPYLLYRDSANIACDSFYCDRSSEEYPLQVADNFYFNQQYYARILDDVQHIPVGSQRRYRYSDANFYLMQQVLEKISGTRLDELARQYFYTPLGLRYTDFRPLEHYSRDKIVPTQMDDRWRHQLVHGYVHDETAALLGGVSGHAGLFANAEDLAVIFQMLLNDGYYGDRRYLQPETVRLFTSAIHGNHRGFGFDTAHPDSHSAFSHSASERTFGHTGFTGTCVWADPDNDIVFVFLSNRINPDIRNKKLFKNRVRERMHQVVYDALNTYQPGGIDREIELK